MRLGMLSLFVVPIVLGVSTVKADLVYSYVTDLPNYDTNVPVDVQIYLQEVSTGGSTSLLDPANNLEKLGAFRVAGARVSGAAVFTGTTFNTINPVFDFGQDKTVSGGGTAVILNGVDSDFVGETSISGGANIRLVPLGTIRITPGSPGDVTTFSLYDDDNLGGNNGAYTLLNFYALDVPSGTAYDAEFNEIPYHFAGTAYTFTVSNPTVVPEPASLGLLAVGSAALLLRKRR